MKRGERYFIALLFIITWFMIAHVVQVVKAQQVALDNVATTVEKLWEIWGK